MKRVLLSTLILIGFTAITLYAAVSFQYFTAKSSQDGILLEWKTSDEGGASHFELERSAGSADNFIYLKTINSTGNNSYYSYQDNTVSNRSNSSIYYYRLKCVQPNGTLTYTPAISVMFSVSGIRDTWGSIKAIFR